MEKAENETAVIGPRWRAQKRGSGLPHSLVPGWKQGCRSRWARGRPRLVWRRDCCFSGGPITFSTNLASAVPDCLLCAGSHPKGCGRSIEGLHALRRVVSDVVDQGGDAVGLYLHGRVGLAEGSHFVGRDRAWCQPSADSGGIHDRRHPAVDRRHQFVWGDGQESASRVRASAGLLVHADDRERPAAGKPYEKRCFRAADGGLPQGYVDRSRADWIGGLRPFHRNGGGVRGGAAAPPRSEPSYGRLHRLKKLD